MNKDIVYTLTFPRDDRPTTLALDCHMYKGWLRFFDTCRGHQVEGHLVDDNDKGFTFWSEGYEPGPWKFKVLTLEDFRREIYKIVVNGKKLAETFQTTEDIYKWYREEYEEE